MANPSRLFSGILTASLCCCLAAGCSQKAQPTFSVEPAAPVAGSEAAASTEAAPVSISVEHLPEGFRSLTDEQGDVYFLLDQQIVGGIACYPIPQGTRHTASDSPNWLLELGIPDLEDPSLCYTLSGSGNSWTASCSSDVAKGEAVSVRREHHFQAVGSRVYDLWADSLKLSHSAIYGLIDAVDYPQNVGAVTTAPEEATDPALADATVSPQLTQEQALEQSRLALEKLQAGESLILVERFYDKDSTRNFSMEYDSAKNQAGTHVPWLLRFSWQDVSFIGQADRCVMLRIDAPFDDTGGTQDYYFAYLNFRQNGLLDSVTLDCTPYEADGYSQIETILSFNSGT